jgi:excisionase family DNA binding protein
MSLAEAARLLSVSQSYLRNAVHRGRLSAVKIGRNYVVDSEEVERYASENLGKRGRPHKRP